MPRPCNLCTSLYGYCRGGCVYRHGNTVSRANNRGDDTMVMEARPSTKSGRTKKAPPAQNRAKAYKKRVEAHMRAVAERVAEAHVPAPR